MLDQAGSERALRGRNPGEIVARAAYPHAKPKRYTTSGQIRSDIGPQASKISVKENPKRDEAKERALGALRQHRGSGCFF